MIFTVVVFFFTCMLPFRALVVYVVVVPHEEVGAALGNEGYFPLLYFCRIMFYVNSAVNPILYNLMSSKFRSGFLKLCGLKTNCLRKHTRALLRTSTFNTSTLTAITTSSMHRASLFDTINRSKPLSFNRRSSSKSSQHSYQSSKFINYREPQKCQLKMKKVNRSTSTDLNFKTNILGMKRSFSSDSFFRAERRLKSTIKFVNRRDSNMSKPMLNGVHQCHSILKKHKKRSASVIVRKANDEDDISYQQRKVLPINYVSEKSELKESFV